MSKTNLVRRIISQLKMDPNPSRLAKLLLAKFANKVSPETVALLDFPLHSRRRWDEESPHRGLYNIINANRALYKSHLQEFLTLSDFFINIPEQRATPSAASEPHWNNGWIPALDGIALYGFMVANKPKLYLEVGSGNSTMFARKAIVDHNLDTKIISIDPHPRAEINNICDEIIRKPVEELDLKIFDRLGANDILYIDNSHRVFMNSDVTTIFLDVIPQLKSGVFVEIHDIALPYDYPSEWVNRYFSEQYLLGAYMLAQGNVFDIILPNKFISFDTELKGVLAPLWKEKELENVVLDGCSFWIVIN